MPNIDVHPHGSFCWMELHSTDQNASKAFYGSLFDWKVTDFPMGPGEVYTIFEKNGRQCSAACTQRHPGAPSYWMLYIAVDDVDAATDKAKELGATIVGGPFDVASNGRMSVVQDPAGAHVCLWKGNMTPGIGIGGEANTFCWADHSSPDRDVVKAFYTGLFGWTLSPGMGGSDENGYLHIENGARMIGGFPPKGTHPEGVPAHWLLYYMVEDIDAATAKATGLGATLHMPPMVVEGAGKMSIVADPTGAVLALWQQVHK